MTYGKSLPRINVFGYFFETNYIPSTFSFSYGVRDQKFDATVITDFELSKFICDGIPKDGGKIIASLHETRLHDDIVAKAYDDVYANYSMFDLILTHDTKLLTLPNARLRLEMQPCLNKNIHTREWPLMADDTLYGVHPKNKNISCVSSNKAFLPGHVKRLEFVNAIQNTSVDLYGVGFNEIVGKIDALRDYRFSIAIENAYLDNWATEKLGDCFLTGTIPVYYGCPNVGDMFNTDGIIIFDAVDNLLEIVSTIDVDGDELYASKMDAVLDNFNRVKQYAINTDQWFEMYIKELL